ncbi:hypothetical protein [Metabacillus malikii]|uniref:DUF3068 domain-containing protein n=1 Tax=Metabacillus malikii TaxID=1504265 RepID=A0ABT9ZJY0_9BACI|nr:hypothetical protein [Metabacillus malikii]MDQ0232600.1 hypothetical protein [Metabacillus malikii]
MKKKLVFFFIGTILLLTSLPIGTKMAIELIHTQKMNQDYKITNVSEGFPPTDSTYIFKDHIVEIEETIKDKESYIDPWNNKVVIADLSIKLDGQEIDTMNDYPIRLEEEGLNRYYGEIAYLTLEDKKNDKTQFVILLKKTRELLKEMPNGDIVGGVPVEKLKFTLYTLDEKGTLKNKSFSFSERDALQTELLNAGFVVPYSIGYYTDAWEGYPSLLFPFIFPFGTFVVGVILIIFYIPIKKVKK